MNRSCNNCGRCCNETPCRVALALIYDADFGKPCPALERHGEEYLCGMALDINKYAYNKANIPSYVSLESIAIKMKQEFLGVCDSKFGNSEIDQRIPIHQI